MFVPLGHPLIGLGEEPAVDISCKEGPCSPSLSSLMPLPLPYSQPSSSSLLFWGCGHSLYLG